MNSWIVTAYDIIALIGAFLSIYVMQKTESDQINRVDPIWLQWIRRGAFGLVSTMLAYSILSNLDGEWTPSLVVLLLVMAGVGNLTVNAIALYLRAPPTGKRSAKPIPRGVVWRP